MSKSQGIKVAEAIQSCQVWTVDVLRKASGTFRQAPYSFVDSDGLQPAPASVEALPRGSFFFIPDQVKFVGHAALLKTLHRSLQTMSREHRTLEQVLSDFWSKFSGKPRQISPPWDENWKLDAGFFKGLADWDSQHPDSKFISVLEKIRLATITGKPFLDLIPDTPFPARTLVLALSHFLQLGIAVALAKVEVFKFVDELASWVVNIESTFEDGRGKFSSRARNNLKHLRDLLNEIFKWSWSRLNDGRWEMLVHGLSIVDEIRDFNQRLDKARGMFSVLQDIDTAAGIDEILREIREIKKLRKSQISDILDHLKRTQLENERRQFLERTLYRYALRDTGYDRQGKDPCDPDTRIEILETIKEWVNDVSEGSQNFFWLTGDPGSGKSAITASFARNCKDNGVLWAQFFINRNNESTTNPQFYFPSIACQMAEHIADPTVTVAIHEILRKKESLLDKLSVEQALEFFVKVVQVACDLDRTKPVAIIFDGLDETSRNHLKVTARVFSELFTKLERYNAKVFISSRTDDEITRPFYASLQTDSQHVKHLHLDTYGSRKDVEVYLRRHLEDLVSTWALDWKRWPGEERFEKLCEQAGGLFIWAVTVVKFFAGQLERHGRERGNRILGMFNEKGMGDVNKLYGAILEMTFEADAELKDDWEYERFRWIVGFIIELKEPLTIGDLSGLIDLRETLDSDPVDVLHFVRQLRTVLVVGTGMITNDTIPRLHKSFVEYITSERAGPQLRIDSSVVYSQIATKCLRVLGRLRNDGGMDILPIGSVRYSIKHWTSHLAGKGISESGVGIVGDSAALWKTLSMTAALKKGSNSASGDYRTHMYDPKIGLPLPATALVTPPQYSHSSTIQAQGSSGISAIAVSPDSKLIASGDFMGVVQIWDSKSHQPIGTAGKHDTSVGSVCFSPDSRWLVSAGMSVRIWDCGTGQAVGPPLQGHAHLVKSVCTDGQKIISGSHDATIRIWSCDTFQLVGEPINTGHVVSAVALSNSGRIAAGVGHDVCIFDAETRQQVASMKGHSKYVWTVAFSSDCSQLASGSADYTIRIWDVQTQNQMHRLDGHTKDVFSVVFSSDGDWIVSGAHDKTVRLWNTETGKPVGLPLRGHTGWVSGATFSPDSLASELISGSYDNTIRIWSAPRKWQKPSQKITAIHFSQHPASSPNDRISLDGHPSVISACCSPDGSLYAASTLEGQVSIWNLERKLVWETTTSIHPIHLLRFSETQLSLSAPDGSTSCWNLSNGKPMDVAISRGSQIGQCTSLSDDISWLPLDFGAGLWAYVDGCLVSFEGESESITIFDLPDPR